MVGGVPELRLEPVNLEPVNLELVKGARVVTVPVVLLAENAVNAAVALVALVALVARAGVLARKPPVAKRNQEPEPDASQRVF